MVTASDTLQLMDVSAFKGSMSWWFHKKKAIIVTVLLWLMIISIFIVWMYRAVIKPNQYRTGSYYLLLIDCILVFIYVYFVMPHHNMSNNKFTGIKEIDRQLEQQIMIDEINDKLSSEMVEMDDKCPANNFKETIEMLRKQVKERDQRIKQLEVDNKDLFDKFINE